MHVCLFDIDGTLIATGGAGMAAIQQALLAEFGITEPKLVPLHGRTDRAIAHDLFCLHGVEPSEASWQRLREAYLARLPASLRERRGQVLPGVGGVLELLAQRTDVAVGLLTGNVRAGAQIKLEHYGLMEHFGFGGFGDHHIERDDVAREALTEARGRLDGQLALDRVWVIGDTPRDVACARAIGVRAAAVATGNYTPAELADAAPDLLLDDLADPSEFFDRLS